MTQVAAHQDQAAKEREQYTYTQKVHIRALHSNGKLSREESTVYNVIPTADGTKKSLAHFSGRYQSKGKLVDYWDSEPGQHSSGLDIDASLLPSLRDDLVNDKSSKDGLTKDMFPLTSSQQKKYQFELLGEQMLQKQSVYRIRFWPRKEFAGFDDNQTIWEGEVFVDKDDLQPLAVSTHMAKGFPILVKTLLGTNLHQLGYTVNYRRVGNGVYFPVNYGGEFEIKAVFFYKRTITLSLENSDFRRGDAQSTVRYEATK